MLFLLGAVLALGACASDAGTAPSTLPPMAATASPSSKPFRIVGYVTQAVVLETIVFDQVTHINYAFLIPNANGTFKALPNAWKLEKIVENAHQNGADVLISVGGWGWDAQFESMAADPGTRAVFVQELTKFIDQYKL